MAHKRMLSIYFQKNIKPHNIFTETVKSGILQASINNYNVMQVRENLMMYSKLLLYIFIQNRNIPPGV